MRVGFLGIVYIVVGVFVAGSQDYFERTGQLEGLLTAVLGVLLWPLLLVGIDIRVE